MSNLPNRAHPPWCLRGPDCDKSRGLHLSRVIGAAPRGDEIIQVGAALSRMDVGPVSPGGVLLELSGDDVDRWPIDLAQAVALTHVLQRLIRRTRSGLPRAA